MQIHALHNRGTQKERVLVSGAGFAGLSTAYWLNRLGYAVTVIDIAPGLRKGGTPVDIRDQTIDVMRRMDLMDAVIERCLPPRPTAFKDADDVTQAALLPEPRQDGQPAEGYEIDRDVLLELLFTKISSEVDVHFGTVILSLVETDKGLRVTFGDGTEGLFSLVFGCDGNHSALRRLHFGPEEEFSHFMGLYFSICIVDGLVTTPNTTEIYNEPGKTVMLNSYEDKTDIVLCFRREDEISCEHRDSATQRQIVIDQFSGMGWRVPVLLEMVRQSENFYFDKMSQVKMPFWTKGRVALVGDAAYCASPAAGMGGSLAILGAAALADALRDHSDDIAVAFRAYDDHLRPFIDEVQEAAISFGAEIFVPFTAEAIRARNERISAAQM